MRSFFPARAATGFVLFMSVLKHSRILLALAVFPAGQSALANEHMFEVTADLSAASFLPKELLQGEHHVVDDRVRNDGYLNYYMIRSDYGEFEAISTAMLRTRIGEINAMAELDELSKTEVFAKAAANAGMRQVKTLRAFAAKPVETVKGIPAGIGRMFNRFKRQAGEAVDSTKEFVADDDEQPGDGESDENDDSNAVVDLTGSYLGVDKAHRAWSRKLGTDPYSSNEVLQAAIKEVAWAERLGRFGMGFAGVPKIAGANIIKDVNEAVWSKDPYELRDLNQARLVATGAGDELIEQYLDNPRMTPSQQTLYTAAIAELAEVSGRAGMLRQASLPATEHEMSFLIKSAMLLAWYHINQQPIDSVKTDTVVPYGETSDGTLVSTFAIDHGYWTETSAEAIASRGGLVDTGQRREAWLLGTLSERCRAELEAAGFEVHTNTGVLLAEGS